MNSRETAERSANCRTQVFFYGGMLVLAAMAVDVRAALAVTLNEALAAAYTSNPTLLAARKDIDRTDELVPQAYSQYLPSADAVVGGGYARSEANSSPSAISQDRGPVGYLSFRMTQPIYKPGVGSAIGQAESSVYAARARAKAVEQDVLLRAASAYLDVVRATAIVKAAEEYQKRISGDRDSLTRQFALGQVRRSAVAEADFRVAAATARVNDAEGALNTTRVNYNAVIGEMPIGEMPLSPLPPSVPASLDEAIAQADNNPAVVAADFAERAARAGVNVTEAQKLPQFFFQGDVNPRAQTALALMSVPIFRPVIDPQVRASKEAVKQRRLEADAARLQVRQTIASAWQTYQTAGANVAAFEAQIKSARIAADGIGREQALGLRPALDLIISQSNVLDSQVNLVTAKRDVRVAAYMLLSGMGRLTAENLELDVPIYNPEAHLDKVKHKVLGTGAEGD